MPDTWLHQYPRILALSPHTDDAELGCGATLAKYKFNGAYIRVIAFSIVQPCLRDEFKESIDLLKPLTGSPCDCRSMDYPVREFEYNRQSILDAMIDERKEFDPQIVFVPSSSDVHQDHQVIHNEAIRAFKNTTILGYELPWNDIIAAKYNLYEQLQNWHIVCKCHMVECYKSQESRIYTSRDAIYAQARTRGLQAGSEFAEVFEVIRWIQ